MFRHMPLYRLFIHRLSLPLPAPRLHEPLNLIHRPQIPVILPDYVITTDPVIYLIFFLISHQCPLSLLLDDLGFLSLDVLFNLITDPLISILLKVLEDLGCVGFEVVKLLAD